MELEEAASSAWLEVSKLEEELAKIKPAEDAEGRIARRGAVRAALKANDLARAEDLAKRFAAEGASQALRKELRELLKVESNGLSEKFPSALRHHKPSEVLRHARLLLERGPFLLAA
ncbi:MAG: hypothetical protein HY360_00565 [Verrucomicrobia bacterium]|nr:hypothetical protein [Verrucomicrobiota bacterium]